MEVLIAQGIPKGHWLQGDEFEEFCNGYAYAETQTLAIPALAKCAPGELYYFWYAMKLASVREAQG